MHQVIRRQFDYPSITQLVIVYALNFKLEAFHPIVEELNGYGFLQLPVTP